MEEDKSPSIEIPKTEYQINELDKSPDHLVQSETDLPNWYYYYRTTTV